MAYSGAVPRHYFLLVPVLALGIAGAGVAIRLHESDAAFLYRQEHPLTVEAPALAALVKKAPDPVPGGGRAPSRSASCVPGRGGQLRNPWQCTVVYTSGHLLHYRITIRPNGSYAGSDPTGQFVVTGCCVPGASPTGA